MKKALVSGAGGFVGSHLVKRLKSEGYWVRGADLRRPEFSPSPADEFLLADLREPNMAGEAVQGVDEIYQLAAEGAGVGQGFTRERRATSLHNAAAINLNTVEFARRAGVKKIFYASSASVYPAYNLANPNHPKCAEDSAVPAAPDSDDGWEKLFSERLYLAYGRNCGMQVRIARLHNTFGPEGTWTGGGEKAPAAMCRKVAEARQGGDLEVWGDGTQTRSFLYIDECIEGIRRLMESEFTGPVNLGSEEMVSISQLAKMVMQIAGKQLTIRYITGPVGVRGRSSDNGLIEAKLGWKPLRPLREGLETTYAWIAREVSWAMASRA